MDHFGIGAAIKACVGMYQQAAKQSGRTTSLIESVKDGDRVIFANTRQAELFERNVAERGIKVECRVIDPRLPHEAPGLGTGPGRTIFDHVWVEQYYVHGIDRMGRDLDDLERMLTGEGPAHRETRWQARELAKWGPLAPFVPPPRRQQP